ncbi:uncharacterized protein [Henckelia pumila]|uniref:uncharacterized protein n=1 Tax=Henckelia pumila TaxID=405737 RepID=UPI003C6DFCBB
MILSHRNRSEEIYFSAPSSPSNLSDQFFDTTVFDDFDSSRSSVSSVPFGWEEKPGTPKSPTNINQDFEFAFSVAKFESGTVSLSAEELFHGGVIKPLKPPPCLQKVPSSRERTKEFTAHKKTTVISSLAPPLLLTRKKMMHFKNKESVVDPFEIAARNATKSDAWDVRGRERSFTFQKSSSRRETRSLSPCRVTKYAWEDHNEQKWRPAALDGGRKLASSLCSESHKKWRLKHLFFSRSTTNGRGEADKSKSYMATTFRRWSFRDTGTPGSRRESATEEPDSVHTTSRSDSHLHKKKFLPHNHGIVAALVRCGFTSKKIIK